MLIIPFSLLRTDRTDGSNEDNINMLGPSMKEKIKQQGGGVEATFDILVREHVDFRDVRY